MPELIEVEYYRRALDRRVGASVSAVSVVDGRFCRAGSTDRGLLEQVIGMNLMSTHRHGKLLLADFGRRSRELTVGMRFGMTGRLLFDGRGPIDSLEFSSTRNDPKWDRFTMVVGTEVVSIRDPRRLGSIEIDPDVASLGPDAWDISARRLRSALTSRRKSLKAVLLDQSILAGLGNLLTDEILWRSAFSPRRSCAELSDDDLEDLAAAIRQTVADLALRGGSHRGDSFPLRAAGALCPLDDATMRHDTVGGRSTWWCPRHQR